MGIPGDVHRITTLAGGLRVVTEHVPGARSVSLACWIGTGSRHEGDDQRGYAHFLEHLLFKGNQRIDAEGISRWFDGIGSDANAATTREYTVVHARVLERHVADSLRVFGEMLLAPAFRNDDVNAEREVILEEIAMYEDSPSDVVHELADELVFAGNPLGLPILGTTESITSAKPEQVLAFHRAAYEPARLVISAAGAVDHDEFVAIVQDRFLGVESTNWPSSPSPTYEQLAPTQAAPGVHVPALEIRHKDTEQVHLVLAGRGIARHDDRRHTAALLDMILGNAPSSRLFLEVRERRGLAYSIYSFLSSNSDAGQVGIYVGVRPDRVETVLNVLRTELRRITTTLPTTDELDLAKGHIEGRMLLSMESTTVRGNRLGASLVTGMPIEDLDDVVQKLRAVTADDVLELATDLYAPESLSLAVVADDVDDVRRAADRAGLLRPERAGARS
jgi:predicted Zn-dependent peptidase